MQNAVFGGIQMSYVFTILQLFRKNVIRSNPNITLKIKASLNF